MRYFLSYINYNIIQFFSSRNCTWQEPIVALVEECQCVKQRITRKFVFMGNVALVNENLHALIFFHTPSFLLFYLQKFSLPQIQDGNYFFEFSYCIGPLTYKDNKNISIEILFVRRNESKLFGHVSNSTLFFLTRFKTLHNSSEHITFAIKPTCMMINHYLNKLPIEP